MASILLLLLVVGRELVVALIVLHLGLEVVVMLWSLHRRLVVGVHLRSGVESRCGLHLGSHHLLLSRRSPGAGVGVQVLWYSLAASCGVEGRGVSFESILGGGGVGRGKGWCARNRGTN